MTDINQEFCKLAGICWHDRKIDGLQCSKCGKAVPRNIDYSSSPVAVLRIMSKREDFALFMARLMYVGDNVEAIDWDNNIDIDFILDESRPCKLILIANEWMKSLK